MTLNPSRFALAAALLLAGAGAVSAQTTTTTTTKTFTNEQGTVLREYSTTQHYNSYNDPAMHPTIGTAIPGAVTVYPLPGTVTVERPDRYNYAIINNNPVIIERENRRVIHTWP